jgi:hypothetical protein
VPQSRSGRGGEEKNLALLGLEFRPPGCPVPSQSQSRLAEVWAYSGGPWLEFRFGDTVVRDFRFVSQFLLEIAEIHYTIHGRFFIHLLLCVHLTMWTTEEKKILLSLKILHGFPALSSNNVPEFRIPLLYINLHIFPLVPHPF